MKPTKITNIILAFIAGCLFMLVLQQIKIVPELRADHQSPHLYPGTLPLDENGNLKVSISNLDEIDVNISGISTYEELDVNIKELDDGPIRVEID